MPNYIPVGKELVLKTQHCHQKHENFETIIPTIFNTNQAKQSKAGKKKRTLIDTTVKTTKAFEIVAPSV